MALEHDLAFDAATEQRDLGQVSTLAVDFQPTWRDRLRWKLFPRTHCELPEVPPGTTTKDCITIHTKCGLSIADRIRVLVSGRLEVTTRTVTQNEVGQSITSSACFPLGPKWMERS